MVAGKKKPTKQEKEEEERKRDADEEHRTTAFGLFNFAHSYWRAAAALRTVKVNASHPDDPAWFLYCHSVELFLKSFLRAHDTSAVELRRKFAHNIIKLANAAKKAGLVIEARHADVIGLMEEMDDITLRYMRTGSFRRASFEDLDDTCRYLHGQVAEVLKSQGKPVRFFRDR